jgi:hypothetical protein
VRRLWARDICGDFAFCPHCGAELALPAPVRELRKTVTVLFCDVTGSTSLGESVDPEALRGLLARYFERMRGIVERHGGTVEKFIGDAVMAVFGVPVLHEDEALRAVRAAAEMRDALPELGLQAPHRAQQRRGCHRHRRTTCDGGPSQRGRAAGAGCATRRGADWKATARSCGRTTALLSACSSAPSRSDDELPLR